MIFLLNLRVVVLFLLMTPRYMQPVLTPNSVVQESQPIWMLLQNGQTVSWGMLFSAEKSEHLHIGKATGQRVTMRGVPIPEVKHHHHLGLVMNNKPPSWTEHIKDMHGTCSRMIGVLRRLRRRLQGTQYSQGRDDFHRCHSTTQGICVRPKFGVEDQLKAYKDYNIRFARDMGFTCLHYRLDSTITLWFCSTR